MNPHPILERLHAMEHEATPADPTSKRRTKRAAFAAQGRFDPESLRVRIDSAGALDAPLSAASASTLHLASRPATFGHRERTLLDPSVRHTGEIDPAAVSVDWSAESRTRLLREISSALETGPLEVGLHALLVYGPGQFFKPHQDTEKHEGMVGTLVLVWPSAHIGGELRVRHGSREFAFASQQLGTGEIRWCAFFTDCRHEVMTVEEGWRVALVFDLLVPENAGKAKHARAPDPGLQLLMRQEFGLGDTPSASPWAMLLEHEYSERGLRWHLLKGPDRERVAAMRAAAEPLGLSVQLALFELYEMWAALPSPDAYRRHAETDDDPEPDELIDSSLKADYWVDADGTTRRGLLRFDADRVHAFTETGAVHLIDEHYEGYMGNYGETLEYWYRRGALVIQTPTAADRSRYRMDPDGTLADLLALTKDAGDIGELARRFAGMRDLLAPEGKRQEPRWLATCATIAAALPESEDAITLMAGFHPAAFCPADAQSLALLQRSRGSAWLLELWDRWARMDGQSPILRIPDFAGHDTGQRRSGLWPEPLREFVLACRASGVEPGVLDRVVGVHALDALLRIDARRSGRTPAERLEALPAAIGNACELARAMNALDDPGIPLERLLAHVVANPVLYPLSELAPLVVALEPDTGVPAAQALRTLVSEALADALSRPERGADDHTIEDVEWICACADCMPVRRWAESPTAEPLVIPMAEARRKHVVERMRGAAAPVLDRTIKQGSPYRLRLDKSPELHARKRAKRQAWREALRSISWKAMPPDPARS